MTTPRLTKFAAGAVLAVGLAMAGLGAAVANADPAQPSTPGPNPTAPHNPHSESGLCNQTVIPRGAPEPPPGYCG